MRSATSKGLLEAAPARWVSETRPDLPRGGARESRRPAQRGPQRPATPQTSKVTAPLRSFARNPVRLFHTRGYPNESFAPQFVCRPPLRLPSHSLDRARRMKRARKLSRGDAEKDTSEDVQQHGSFSKFMLSNVPQLQNLPKTFLHGE